MVTVSAAFRSNAGMYRDMGTPLYGCLFERAVDDPTLIELASHGQDGARPVHLLSAVHDLLLRDSSDPLSRFFPTLNDNPASPEQAFPELQRFCRERRSEILSILQSRTVQSTYVERCWSLMPALAFVSELAGEPLNLIEIGCSAGVLLTYDSYGYAVPGHGIIGCSGAPLILSGHYAGRPPLKIPVLGTRIGIDLHPVNTKSADERRWLLALCLPELREQQLRLSTALEVVATSEMHLLEGDALDRLSEALASVEGPICVFHSVCLLYWSTDAKTALHEQLREESRKRDIFRLGFELSGAFDSYHAGRSAVAEPVQRPAGATFDVTFTCYGAGQAESRVIAHTTPDFTSLYWLG
jgi:hypothetical protein